MTVCLEAIGRPHDSQEQVVFEVTDFLGIPKIFVVTDKQLTGSLSRFLLERNVYGAERALRIKDVFHRLASCQVIQEILAYDKRTLQILPLDGAIFCNMWEDFRNIAPYNGHRYDQTPLRTFPQEISRQVAGDHVTAICANTNKNRGSFQRIIYADTCAASGGTLREAVEFAIQKWGKPNLNGQGNLTGHLEEVVVICACGSWQALRSVAQICAAANIKLTCILAQAIFETVETPGVLGLNWTDLPILNPGKGTSSGTITTREYHNYAQAHNQGKLICAVGDVGNSLWDPRTYLRENMLEMARLQMDLTQPAWTWMISEFQEFQKQELLVDAETATYFHRFL